METNSSLKPELTPLKAWILFKHLQPNFESLVATCRGLGVSDPEKQAAAIMDTLSSAERHHCFDIPAPTPNLNRY